MAEGDGDGWVRCRCGGRHWGLHGAAGLMLLRSRGARPQVLLQLRAHWTHQGGTWGLPGGAADSHEDATAAALREAHEETGVAPSEVRVLEVVTGTDHGDWSYRVLLGVADAPVRARVVTAESDQVRWVDLPDVDALALHPGLAAGWRQLRMAAERHLGAV